MKVRCVNNNWNNLTKGKVYDVIYIIDSEIQIYNDLGDKQTFYIGNFEVIKEENKMQEKTFREVIADIKEGEVWESHCKKIIGFKDGDFEIRDNDGHKFGNAVSIRSANKYRLKRKECNFEEAFKAYEEGKEIESCYSQYKYKKEGGLDLYSKTENEWYGEDNFEIDEIRGKWYINN